MLARFQQRTRRLALERLENREMLSSSADLLSAGRAAAISDDYGNTMATAATITLSSSGSASQSGKIETAGDGDVFRFTATATGKVTIGESAASGSRLDSYVYVYDAKGKLLAKNDDYGRSLNSCVTINVTAGTTYYVKAAAYGRSTGAYTVQIVTTATATTPTDDFGNTMAAATTISLSAAGSATKSGKIETAGDVDMFKIVATVTGTMTIQQAAFSGSSLDSHLYVYDSNGQLVGESNDNGTSLNSQVQISVVAGTTYYIKAAGQQSSTGAYALNVATVATTTEPSDDGFQITATITGMTAAQQAVVQQAIDVWEEIIVGDLTDVVYRGRTIDDIEIAISGIYIDGTGNILGQATATAYRSDSHLPYMGYIQLDTADVATMLTDGSLLGVLTHEIAHVLGFGVIWSDLGLLVGASTSSPGFTGVQAVAAYNAIFGTSATAVPVEADGGSGTALSHWEESVFSTELMTGWYNSGYANALSAITIASMADIGYSVNMAAADPYTVPTSTTVASSVSSTRSAGSSRVPAGWMTAMASQNSEVDGAAMLENADSRPASVAGTGFSAADSQAGRDTALDIALWEAWISDGERSGKGHKSHLAGDSFWDVQGVVAMSPEALVAADAWFATLA